MAIPHRLTPIVLMVLLSGCAISPMPPPERTVDSVLPARLRTAPAANPAPDAVRTDPNAHAGQAVLWGGLILSTDNTPPWTRLEVEAHPLTAEGRPDPTAAGQGRFAVELATPFDPRLYAPGRPLTVTGRIRVDATATPVVRADEYYLWDVVDMPPPAALTRRPPPRRPACHYCVWPRPYGGYYPDHGFGGGLRWPYGFGIGYGRGGWGTSIGF